MTATRRKRQVSKPLLERKTEITQLEALLSAARDDEGSVALIEGPPGIGKTRLLTELRRRAPELGLHVLAARGGETERDFAFGIVRQLVEPEIANLGERERAQTMGGAARLAEPVLAAPGSSRPPRGPPEAMLHGLYWLFANLAENGALLLAVDDAQWTDPSSLGFLGFLARRLEGLPIVLVLAARSGEPGVDAALLRPLLEDAESSLVRPDPLSPAAVAELVREELGTEVSDEICSACGSATGGNPFMLREVIAELREIGPPAELSPEAIATLGPERIATSVLMRVGRLGEPAPALANAMAILERAELRDAAALAGIEFEAAGPLADGLAATGVLSEGRPLQFIHPIVRTAIYEDMPEGERRAGHARAARLLAAEGAPPERIAAHLLEADPAGDQAAVETLRAAARAALARGAPGAAANFLRRAVAEPPGVDLRFDVLHELGTAEALEGDPGGIENLQQALAEAPAGRSYAEVARVLARALVPLGRLDEAVAMLDAAISQLPDDERELALTLEAEAATAGRLFASTYARTVDRLRRYAGRIEGETPAERLLLANLACLPLLEGGSAREAAELAERALAGGLLAEQGAGNPTVYDALYCLIAADDFEFAQRYCDATLEDARAHGSLLGLAVVGCFRSRLAYWRGEVEAAENEARAAIDAAQVGQYDLGPLAMGSAFLADVLIERGELAEAADALEQAGGGVGSDIPDTFMANDMLYSRGRLQLASQDVEGGVADLLMLGEREKRWRDRNPGAIPYRSSAAVGLAQLGERGEARRLAGEEVELARVWATPRAIGNALRALGAVEGDEGGIEHLREAVSTLEGSGSSLEHARALTDLGSALRRAGKRSEARRALTDGMDLAHRCGATALAESAREELRVAGARPRRLAATGRDALTASERRVCDLAASGMTNKEIAQALFVTLRTIEMHLSNAYAKLEVSSREELPAALGETTERPR